MRDVLVFGEPLEIKTVTGKGAVKAKWTADNASAQNDISTFEFTADLPLVRIWWGRIETAFFTFHKKRYKIWPQNLRQSIS